jgi:hypothetical protein
MEFLQPSANPHLKPVPEHTTGHSQGLIMVASQHLALVAKIIFSLTHE